MSGLLRSIELYLNYYTAVYQLTKIVKVLLEDSIPYMSTII